MGGSGAGGAGAAGAGSRAAIARIPAVGFGALVVATGAAFFITQHLKIATPLIAGFPQPVPSAIDPYGARCGEVSHQRSRFSFYLLNSADSVNVRIVDSSGRTVRHIARNHPMRVLVRHPDGDFSWDGRDDSGRVVPDGSYLIKVDLLHRGRTVTISNTSGPEPIRIETRAPKPVVTSVVPRRISAAGGSVTITYAGNEDRGGTVRIYRTDGVRPRIVKSFLTPWRGQQAVWNGRIDHRPAPQGVYLMGLDVTDAACSTGHFPVRFPPPAGSTAHAGVTVSYLSAQPLLDGIPAQSGTAIEVRSAAPLRWRVIGPDGPIVSGVGRRIAPPLAGGLYELALSSRLANVSVPLLVRSRAPVLAALPVLGWQGEAPVDDNGDGLVDTLSGGSAVRVLRALPGLPAGFGAEGGLLARFANAGHRLQAVADLALGPGGPALGAGRGPVLEAHRSVLLVDERWFLAPLGGELARWVRGGGRLVSIGVEAFSRPVQIRGGRARAVGGAGSGAQGALDPFGIAAGAPCAKPPCVIERKLGRGVVLEVRAAPGAVDGRLLARVWAVLTKGR